ncbi:MAG: nucleotidyltransferase domain-containing protein [Candidatus Hydrogenedentes bacterium]|nr:nucleotidyltransferase domain-containing protein [Candidatus Hydrogenedentota bacterium]
MRTVAEIRLEPEIRRALQALREQATAEFEIRRIILYGSAARGDTDEESDQDVLALTRRPLTRADKDRISEIAFNINFEHGTNLSVLVIDENAWDAGLYSVMPFHSEVLRDGVAV